MDRPPRLSVVKVPAADAPSARSNELLGLAPDARVLIVNCDDFGMCPAINAAVVQSIEEGIGTSCSVMVPCPGAAHAMALLRARSQIPFGIHLTLVCDTDRDRWWPLTAKERVPSLLDDAGELVSVRIPPALENYGRLRAVTALENGSLLITTDNGGNDAVLRVRPVS